jgi:hypothetical protein
MKRYIVAYIAIGCIVSWYALTYYEKFNEPKQRLCRILTGDYPNYWKVWTIIDFMIGVALGAAIWPGIVIWIAVIALNSSSIIQWTVTLTINYIAWIFSPVTNPVMYIVNVISDLLAQIIVPMFMTICSGGSVGKTEL